MLQLRRALQAWFVLLWIAVAGAAATLDRPWPSQPANFNTDPASSEASTDPSTATANATNANATIADATTANATTANTTAATTTTPPPDAGPKTKATPSPNSSSSPALANDMRKILRRVGMLPCSEPVRARMFALLYESNIELHDQCIAESGYQFFPYTGEVPTAEQILATVKSTPCMQIQSGAVLAKFPECDIDYVSVRTAAETYLRIKKDVDDGHTPPTQAQFYELYNLNRVVNLLNENASLIEAAFRNTPTSASVSLTEMTRLMNPIILLPGIALADDMRITTVDDTKPQTTTTTATTPSTTTSGTATSGSSSSSTGSASSGSRDVEATATPTDWPMEDHVAGNKVLPLDEPLVEPHSLPVANKTTKASAGSSVHERPIHCVAALMALAAASVAIMLL